MYLWRNGWITGSSSGDAAWVINDVDGDGGGDEDGIADVSSNGKCSWSLITSRFDVQF